jgi:hypothetical protein
LASESDSPIWRRIRAAAILAGHTGPEAMIRAIATPGMSYTMVRKLVRHETVAPTFGLEDVARRVSAHCRTRGEIVPAWWLLHGFGPADDDTEA